MVIINVKAKNLCESTPKRTPDHIRRANKKRNELALRILLNEFNIGSKEERNELSIPAGYGNYVSEATIRGLFN